MTVYVLYDCIENSDEYAFANCQHVYRDYGPAVCEMTKLFTACLNDHFDANDKDGAEDSYIDDWSARVVNTIEAYRHTWTISKEEVVMEE